MPFEQLCLEYIHSSIFQCLVNVKVIYPISDALLVFAFHSFIIFIHKIALFLAMHFAHANTQGPFGTIGYNPCSETIDRQRDSNLLRTNEPNYQNQFCKLVLTEYTQ